MSSVRATRAAPAATAAWLSSAPARATAPAWPSSSLSPKRRNHSERRLALLLEYQGTAYGGSQLQKTIPTVQGALESALGRLTGEPIRIALAGRTDAGTHASGQVASFVTGSRHSIKTFSRALNALLPADISVRAVAHVPIDFDPRRHALSRLYRYTMYLGTQRPAMLRHFVWHQPAELNIEAMTGAAASLIGRHDFAAFTQPSEARRRSTERVVMQAALRTKNALALFDIEANAFLPQMVRRIVGALVEVGSGRISERDFEALVSKAEAGAANKVAPARGLCLMKVRYESELFA